MIGRQTTPFANPKWREPAARHARQAGSYWPGPTPECLVVRWLRQPSTETKDACCRKTAGLQFPVQAKKARTRE